MNYPATDLLTVGETMLRLSAPPGDLLADSPAFDVHVAGAESNVAAAVARMGYKTRWLSRLTDNALGRRIVHTLSAHGVDCSGVAWTSEDRIGTYYLEHGASPRPARVIYDRAHSAASKMSPENLDPDHVARAKFLHLTGITPALSEGCYALVDALLDRAQEFGVTVIFDVNYRALLWPSADVCAARLSPLLRKADVILCSRADAGTVFGLRGEPADVLRALRDRFGAKWVVLTVGEAGAIGLDGDTLLEAPGYRVEMVDRIGAGDALAAGVICGLLEGDFALGLRYGAAMSALQLTLRGDLFRLDRADVLRLMEQGTVDRPVR